MAPVKNSRKTGGGSTSSGANSSQVAPAERGERLSWFWSVIFVSPGFILSTCVHGAINLVLSLFESSGRIQLRVARMWARSLLWIAGVKVVVEGLANLKPGLPCIIVANHLSYMDTPVILTSIPIEFRFLAKEELFRWWFLGWHLHRAGHIPVPLENPRAAVKTLTRSAEMIRRRGVSLVIFPEGGRSMDGQLQEFIDGASYLAIKAQVPVVPVALIGTREILAMGSGTFHRGRVRLRVGEPISTVGMGLHDRRRLTEMARERVAEMLAR
jgi:1-acyl-sn-glycerol-3-phosphate acyltransferase